jgi:hypothetical protein
MNAQELNQRYFDHLLEKVANVDFPSNQLMNRIESVMRTSEQAEAYTEVLLEKSDSLYPSLQMLDRIHRVMLQMERGEKIREMLDARS